MANVINPAPEGRTKTVLEQLWDRMDRPQNDPQRIRAVVENGGLMLLETSPGIYKDFATGDTAHVSIHNTMSISLSHCRPVGSTLTVVQVAAPKVDIKADAEQRQATCEIIDRAVTHLRCHEAGLRALGVLHMLFDGPALDERSHAAVRTLVEQFYTGSRSGTTLSAVRDAAAKRRRSIYEEDFDPRKKDGRGAGKDFGGHAHN